MYKCTKCGTKNLEDAKFCISCGHQIENNSQIDKSDDVKSYEKEGNILAIISLILYFVATTIGEILSHIIHVSEIKTILSSIFSLCPLAGIIVMIVGRVKYPKNKFLKAVMWIIIGSIVFEEIIPLEGKLIKSSILSLPLVYGLTKIACFISGCCSGILYNGIFNVIYTARLNVAQFPIQLLETIVFLLIFVLCNKFKFNKSINYITLILISIFKLLLDFLRYDHMTQFITKNQYFSIILLVVTIFVYIKNNKKKELFKVIILLLNNTQNLIFGIY